MFVRNRSVIIVEVTSLRCCSVCIQVCAKDPLLSLPFSTYHIVGLFFLWFYVRVNDISVIYVKHVSTMADIHCPFIEKPVVRPGARDESIVLCYLLFFTFCCVFVYRKCFFQYLINCPIFGFVAWSNTLYIVSN